MLRTMDALLIDLMSNAAAAALRLEDWAGACEMASAVLEVSPRHAKALYRRASASAALGERRAARADLEALLALEPKNAAGKRLLDELAAVDVA